MNHDPTNAIQAFADRYPEFFTGMVAFLRSHQDDRFRAGRVS